MRGNAAPPIHLEIAMNATTHLQPAARFIAFPTPARQVVVARPANPAPAIVGVTAARAPLPGPFAASDAAEAGRHARPLRDNLARYAAPGAPALFQVC